MSSNVHGTIIKNTQNFTLASCGPIFMVEWKDRTPLVACHELRRECKAYGTGRPNGVALLTIVQAHGPPPEPEPRAAIADFLGEGKDFIRCSAVVVEGSGFRAALVRGVVTGLTMLARQAFPHQVMTATDATQMFAREFAIEGVDAVALEREIKQLRERAAEELRRRGIAA